MNLAARRTRLTPNIVSGYFPRRQIRAQARQSEPESSGRKREWSDEVPGNSLATPKQLARFLDSFVVGQDTAKKVLSVAVYNHYNRIRAKLRLLEERDADIEWRQESIPLKSNELPTAPSQPAQLWRQRAGGSSNSIEHPDVLAPILEKSNVLVIGPTGSGKTLLAKTLAKVLDVPFSTSDATAFTQAGYVGEDVEMCVQRLLDASGWDVQRASLGIIYIDEADKLARRGSGSSETSKDVSGEGVQQGLLRMLEGSVVTVQGKGLDTNGTGGLGSPGPDVGIGRRGPSSAPRNESYHVDTSNILFILSGAFVGLETIVQSRVAKGSIGFGAPLPAKPDNDDKPRKLPFFTANKPAQDPVLEHGQNLLDLVEPRDLIKYGLIPEFTSRLPIVAALHPLSAEDLMRVLTEVHGALVKQYESLFGFSGVEICFTTKALREICRTAASRGMGARGLRGILEKLLLDPMYDVPGSSVRYVLIDEAVVKGERPASYWSRSQGVQFQTAFNKEEAELHHQSTDGNTLTQLSIGAGAKEPKKIRGWMS